jgi:hypothetical protein
MKWTNPFYRTAVLTAAGLLAGCAASTNARPEIESARALVTEADQSGAAEFAGADVQTAHDRLQLAEEADKAHRDDEAQRYAAEAGINAKLALARAAADKAERAAQESARGVEALREETTHDDTGAPTP